MAILNVHKKELSFNVNSFNTPQEYSGRKAWAREIMSLIFMEKGTYPSLPDMGVGFSNYDYETVDVYESGVKNLIQRQIEEYLPEIPLQDITLVDKTGEKGKYIIFVLTFSNTVIPDDNCVIVASEQKNKLINFKIVM